MADQPEFTKVSNLKDKDKTKLKKYWKDLWGKAYAADIVVDYKPEGKKKQA